MAVDRSDAAGWTPPPEGTIANFDGFYKLELND
jgi:hypothetical protein